MHDLHIKSKLCPGREPSVEGKGRQFYATYWRHGCRITVQTSIYSTQIFGTQPRALPNTESPHRVPIDALSRMELTRSIDKATNKISNSPAQMNWHVRQPVFGVLPFPSLASPYSIRPWVSVPIPRQRMSFHCATSRNDY